MRTASCRHRGLSRAEFLFPLAVLLIAMLAAGCGKKAPAVAKVPAENNATPPLSPATNPESPNSKPPRVPPATIAEGAGTPAALAQLTQVLRRYSAEHRRVPQSLNELTASGYLSALPSPPPGKQFAIDPQQVQVVLQSK